MEIRRFRLGDEAALFRVYFTAIHEVASRNYSPEQVEAWAPQRTLTWTYGRTKFKKSDLRG